MRFAGFFFAAVIVVGTAASAATPDEIAQRRAASEKVLAETPEAKSTWESLGDGALRHKPSGLVCPSNAIPDIPLTKLIVLASPPPEHNALCTYRSTDGMKSTDLAATKVAEGTPAEIIFKGMRDTLLQQDKDAKSLGPQSNILVPAALGEAFATLKDGKPCITVLYVVIVKGWAVWTVASMPSVKQDAFSVQYFGITLGAPFIIGVQGVVRTAQGIPEPRISP